MVNRIRSLVLGVVLLTGIVGLVSSTATDAKADSGCYGGYGGWGYGSSGLYTQYSIPYFALHPPVYYSYPVPRTYGYSPWAYPPGVMTPEIEVAGPQNMLNPHVPGAEKTKPTANRVTSRGNTEATNAQVAAPVPQVVINPYVNDKLAGDR